MKHIKKHLSLLGHKVQDKVSGYTGVISNISFDLYGCIQATVRPPVNDKGELSAGEWFDINRLEVLSTEPVMEQPNFKTGRIAEGRKGADNKSVPL